MSKFILTTSANSLAAQIASLINAGGQLKFYLPSTAILSSPVQYLIELDHEKVIGTIGMHVHHPRVTELKHLCVHPDYRRQGLGLKLLERGVSACPTEFAYGAVRSDNATNIRNNFRVGMKLIGKKTRRGYSILIFARRKNANHIYKRSIEKGMY
jgi:GNAT superfamily N-acetyltransferase